MTEDERRNLWRAISSRIMPGKGGMKVFCEEAGLDRSSVYNWVRGKSDPEWKSLKTLADGLHMPLLNLLSEILNGRNR